MNKITDEFIAHLNQVYKINIKQITPINTAFKIITDENKCYILKRVKNKSLINNYNYLHSQKFHHFIGPIMTIHNQYTTKYDNYSYYLTPYVENIDYPLDKRIIDYIELLSKLHKSTNIKRKFNKEIFRRKYEKQKRHLYERFSTLDYYLVECETSEDRSIFMWFYLENYSDLIYTKNILVEVQNKIEQELEKLNQFNYSLIHNNPNIDHFVVTNDQNYLISLDQSVISLKVYDYIKLFIEYCEYQLDWLGLIKNEQITDFEFYYFVFNVIYYMIINMNITNLRNSPSYIAINNLVYDMHIVEQIIRLYKAHQKLSGSQYKNQNYNEDIDKQ